MEKLCIPKKSSPTCPMPIVHRDWMTFGHMHRKLSIQHTYKYLTNGQWGKWLHQSDKMAHIYKPLCPFLLIWIKTLFIIIVTVVKMCMWNWKCGAFEKLSRDWRCRLVSSKHHSYSHDVLALLPNDQSYMIF